MALVYQLQNRIESLFADWLSRFDAATAYAIGPVARISATERATRNGGMRDRKRLRSMRVKVPLSAVHRRAARLCLGGE